MKIPPAPQLRTCDACERCAHERCAGCTGCGCVRSAQYAARVDGPHRAPSAP